jgi:ATP-dependent DNA helicase RecG
LLPKLGPLPQISHVDATVTPLSISKYVYKRFKSARLPISAPKWLIGRQNWLMSTLESSLAKDLGDRTAKSLEKAFGMKTVGDLLRHYPRRYVARGELSDIAELDDGEEATVLAEISAVNLRRASGRTILEVVVTDGSAKMWLTFFNQPWREKELRIGRTGMFAGKVGSFNGKRQLSHPDYQLIPDGNDVDAAVAGFAGKFLPVYPSASKLPSWKLAQCVEIVLDALEVLPDYMPKDLLKNLGYPDFTTALRDIHQPASLESAALARTRLTFDEALLLQILLAQRRNQIASLDAAPRVIKEGGLVTQFEKLLPFTLTDGQKEVNAEIEADMAKSHPMHRLLQGEVGSGKTVVALRAMLNVVDSDGQAALLAPTEVLAQQHYKTITTLLGTLAQGGELGGAQDATQVVLLTGSMPAATKKAALAKIASRDAGIVIGTHALLSAGVDFKDLGLVVVDEQHRFGVEQRDALRGKAKFPPHVLVMTATPIPRTVAMTIFGDLEVSTLRQLPSGRTPITTHVIAVLEKPHYLDRAWQRVKEEVEKGHQVYIVAPRISATAIEPTGMTERDREIARMMDEGLEDEKIPMASVEELAPLLATGALKGLKIAPLHGRQPSELKDSAMAAFSRGEIDVLVATTVIEVGVDVPNASMMVIMDGDRFGVSQLHQLRGRVGRGKVPGLCLIVTSAPQESEAMIRLNAVAGTLDGFELSRIDLEQRSEGDVLGKAQSGVRSHLRLLKVLRDEPLIEKARSVAIELVSKDATLASMPELAAEVAALGVNEETDFMDKG